MPISSDLYKAQREVQQDDVYDETQKITKEISISSCKLNFIMTWQKCNAGKHQNLVLRVHINYKDDIDEKMRKQEQHIIK